MRKPRTWETTRSTDLASIAPAEVAGAVGAFMESRGKPVSEKALAQLASNWRQWRNFANRHGLSAFPLSVAALRGFKLECAVRGLRYETVGRYRQTLSDIHDMMGVAFIWNSTDVVTPLAVDIQDGRSAVSVATEERRQPARRGRKPPGTAPKGDRPKLQDRGANQRADEPLSAQASSAPVASPEPSLAAHAPANADIRPASPDSGTAGDDLAWCHRACVTLQSSLDHIVTSGAERRIDETMELSRIYRGAGYALMNLDQIVPEGARLKEQSFVTQAELAGLIREIRSRLARSLRTGTRRTMNQVHRVSSALIQLCEDDVKVLERIYPPSNECADAGNDDLAAQATTLEERLHQIAHEVNRLQGVISDRGHPEHQGSVSRNHNQEAAR